jgi:isoleucyl-tRNA synthetase
VLTNWYIRRSRERFWDTSGADPAVARRGFNTLFTALEVTCRVTAPLLPLVAEEVWRGLTGGRSVHLADWPDVSALPSDPGLVAAMDRARDVCSAAAALRKASGLRVRLPLPELTVVAPDAEDLADIRALIAAEVNVREVTLLDAADAEAQRIRVSERLTVNARAAGPRLGADVQSVIRASKSGDWSRSAEGLVSCGGITLDPGEFTIETVVADSAGATATLPGGGFIVLDTAVTPQLAAEGLARDVIRVVQQARRAAGLAVTDQISLVIAGSPGAREAMAAHQQLIAGETLASAVELAEAGALDGDPGAGGPAPVGERETVRVRIAPPLA